VSNEAHTTEEAQASLDEFGYFTVEGAVDASLLKKLRREIDSGTRACLQMQLDRGLGQREGTTELPNGGDGALGGAAHHIVSAGGSFLELLEENPLFDIVASHLGGTPFILNSFGAVTNTNTNNMYEHGKTIHRDSRRFFADFHEQCWLMVMVDDFTIDNGATWFLPSSHKMANTPTAERFYSEGKQITGKAGTIVAFDGRLWHAAGKNITDSPRRCLTVSFTLPFLKPQLDYIRCFGIEAVEAMSENLKQLLGYYSRVPSNYDEFYRPASERFYRSSQG